MGNTHYVTVKTPEKGSDFYAVYAREGYTTFVTFVALKDGKLSETEEQISYSKFVQGRVPDKVGNKEVRHAYLDGQITVLPRTDKVWSFEISSTPNNIANFSKSQRLLILEGQFKAGNLVELIDRPDIGASTHGTGGNTHYSFTQTGENKYYSREDRHCRFFLDYSNLWNTKAVVTVDISGPGYGYSYDKTYDCSVVYLGKVIETVFDDTILKTEVERIRTTTAPASFLTDLYKKLGTPQVNNYGNIAAAKKWRQMVPPILALIKKRNVKSISDLYLWWKYSYSTTKMDIESYVEWFRSLSRQKSDPTNGTHYSLTYKNEPNDVTRYNVYLTPYSIGVLEALGLDINFVNTWDLIPFSFVIDWFISIEETLKSLDVADLQSKIDLVSLLTSRKLTETFVPLGNSKIAGDLTSHYYERKIDNVLPRDVCALHFNNPSSHLLDGMSLFVSCKR